MRVVPAQIGLDELIGDQRRIALGRAGGAEDRADEPREIVVPIEI